MSAEVEAALALVVRREWATVVATLLRDVGSLDLAEDAVQEATEAALNAWPDSGVPDKPGAWITTVARRRAIDRLRRERTGRGKAELLGRLEERLGSASDALDHDETLVRDDQLRLIFGCCHPALRVEAQMALTLRSVAGLSTPEIARAFLVSESTMAQRLVRAKRKIAAAVIPFVIPPDGELFERLAVVRGVIYLVFNEGYASSGDQVVRVDLCDEAIRLARLLATLVSDDAECLGLLALCVLTHARTPARTSADGEIVLLEEQDRGLWDQAMIAEGVSVLDRAVRLGRRGPTQVQAAVAALHCESPTPENTDWNGIALLYGELVRLTPTSVVRLNHAVAVAMAHGAQAGLSLLDDPLVADELGQYSYFHSARADLLARAGDAAGSATAYELALELLEQGPEHRLLTRKLASL